MDWSIFTEALSSLAENAPFGFVVVAVLVFCYFMYRKSIKVMSDNFTKNAEIWSKNNKEAFEAAQQTILSLYDAMKK